MRKELAIKQIREDFINKVMLSEDEIDVLERYIKKHSIVKIAEATTQRDILMQTTALENQLGMTSLQGLARLDSCCCDIKQAIREDGEQTRALITQNTIQDLRDRLTAAKDQISDQATERNIVNALRPYPTPSYIVSSPYQSLYAPFNSCGGFYGNGFYGNTIV